MLDIRLLSALSMGAAFTFRFILFQTDMQASGLYTLGYSLSHVILATLIERRNPYYTLIIASKLSLILFSIIINKDALLRIVCIKSTNIINKVAILLFGVASAGVLISSTRLYIYEKDPNAYALSIGIGCLLSILSFIIILLYPSSQKTITIIYRMFYIITTCGFSIKQLLLEHPTRSNTQKNSNIGLIAETKKTFSILTNMHILNLAFSAITSGLMLFYVSPILCIRFNQLGIYHNSIMNLIILVAMTTTLILQKYIAQKISGLALLIGANLINPIMILLMRIFFQKLYNISTLIPIIIMTTACIIGAAGCNYTIATAGGIVNTEKTNAFAFVNSATMLGSLIITLGTYLITLLQRNNVVGDYMFRGSIFNTTADLLLITFTVLKVISLVAYVLQHKSINNKLQLTSKH